MAGGRNCQVLGARNTAVLRAPRCSVCQALYKLVSISSDSYSVFHHRSLLDSDWLFECDILHVLVFDDLGFLGITSHGHGLLDNKWELLERVVLHVELVFGKRCWGWV